MSIDRNTGSETDSQKKSLQAVLDTVEWVEIINQIAKSNFRVNYIVKNRSECIRLQDISDASKVVVWTFKIDNNLVLDIIAETFEETKIKTWNNWDKLNNDTNYMDCYYEIPNVQSTQKKTENFSKSWEPARARDEFIEEKWEAA